MDDSIVARHVRIRIPIQRQWLGRQVIADFERSWEFIEGATGGKLPNRILVVVQWDDGLSDIDRERSLITIGMGNRGAASDPRTYLVHSTAREMARLALSAYSGDAMPAEAEFLLNAMSEMMAREFSRTVKRLEAAWAVCYYLDRVTPLDILQISRRPETSGASRDLRAAAPGITFLMICSELYGRERVFKLFEQLGRKSLEEGVFAAFRVPLSSIESDWLARIRNHEESDITVGGEEEAPEMERIVFTPDPGKAGSSIGVQLYTRDSFRDLNPSGIFLLDETSGRVLQGTEAVNGDENCTQFELPIEPMRQAGKYDLHVIAVDEGGNVRHWKAQYAVVR